MVFLMLRKKELLAKLSKFTKDYQNSSSPCPRFVVLCENSCLFCEFAQLCKQFFLSQHVKKYVTQLTTSKNYPAE